MDALKSGLRPRPFEISDNAHREIFDRVSSFYRACKAAQVGQPDVYQPGGEWKAYLVERQEFYDGLSKLSTAAEWELRNFWRGKLGPIVKEYATFEQLESADETRTKHFCKNVFRNYRTWYSLLGQSVEVLRVPNVGNPWGLYVDQELVVPKATRFHTLATQCIAAVSRISRPTILELGAGYGGMAYYLLRDLDDCCYIDLDLPETLAIAAYYLLVTHSERSIFLYGEQDLSKFDSSEFDIALLPNFVMPNLPSMSADYAVNTFSLSEVGREPLKEYLDQIARICRGKFYHNNMDKRGVVNRGYERVPASEYPMDWSRFRRLHIGFDIFHGHEGDYREYLLERVL
ncbi:MAG: putative sugar O-methyltransferase [Pirellulaceae bacterium]|nr:putative sugar O-methyltransferase [Pirellulaceae bacterium]